VTPAVCRGVHNQEETRMNEELPDYELVKATSELPLPSPPPTRSLGPWIAGALLIIAAGVGVYVAFARRPLPEARPQTATTAPKPVPQPLGGAAESVTIPPLDESDPVVRALVRKLSEHSNVIVWLSTTGLIRNFTVVVANIADGATPAKHLAALRPSLKFRVMQRNGGPGIDPLSYNRYAPIADAVASIDPMGAARLYGTLKPRIEQAYRELGVPDQPFDRTLERAIVSLLQTPIVDGPIALVPKGIGYAYADERLETLTSAQRQLLRMGPRNVGIIERKLREIAVALGIRQDDLPAARP
jgi:hypothetical protein